jgi:hypothetical protein
MAERRRKGNDNWVTLNCEIDANAKLYIIQLAGEMGLGWAVEQLVKTHKMWRKATTNQQLLDTSNRIQ